MPIPTKINADFKGLRKHSIITGIFIVLLILGAKLAIDLGGAVSFTLQTLVLGIGYFLLPKTWRFVLILAYIALGIAGLNVFNGDTGWAYVMSWPLGFFVGFILAAYIPAPEEITFLTLFSYFLQIHVVILTIGICVVGWHAGTVHKATDTLFFTNANLRLR